jgi:hypothetical protein
VQLTLDCGRELGDQRQMHNVSQTKATVIAITVAVVFALGACSASSRSGATMRSSRYVISPADLLDLAKQVTLDKFEILKEDSGSFLTHARWYKLDGDLRKKDPARADGIAIAYLVFVGRTEDGRSTFGVKAIAKRELSGSGLEEYERGDLSKPGWIDARGLALESAIARAARKYQAR